VAATRANLAWTNISTAAAIRLARHTASVKENCVTMDLLRTDVICVDSEAAYTVKSLHSTLCNAELF